ncbi:DUF2007 domain-containing protein [Patescibacteria group bacterium]|nr:DUF2007 domain-containing protein [Patescibacteria group bacterium]
MVKVYSTLYLIEADIIKSILRSNDINCTLWDSHVGLIYPAVTLSKGIRIMVEEKDYEEAREIINDYLSQKEKE